MKPFLSNSLFLYTALNNEFCQFEIFQPQCSKNDVIIISGAIYGRMRIGKCITAKEISSEGDMVENRRYLGCSADIMDVIDQKWSLKSNCQIRILDSELGFDQNTPCLSGLKLYLEVNYTCINGEWTYTLLILDSQIHGHTILKPTIGLYIFEMNMLWVCKYRISNITVHLCMGRVLRSL